MFDVTTLHLCNNVVTHSSTVALTGSTHYTPAISTKLLSETCRSNNVSRMFLLRSVFQAVGMFLGELSCLLAFNIVCLYHKKKDLPMELGDQSFNRFIFLPAAMLDMCGTSLMYVGLNLTFASSFQMLRGGWSSLTLPWEEISTSVLNRKAFIVYLCG